MPFFPHLESVSCIFQLRGFRQNGGNRGVYRPDSTYGLNDVTLMVA